MRSGGLRIQRKLKARPGYTRRLVKRIRRMMRRDPIEVGREVMDRRRALLERLA